MDYIYWIIINTTTNKMSRWVYYKNNQAVETKNVLFKNKEKLLRNS